MTIKKIKYSEWLRLDDFGIVHLDVHLPDCATLLPYLRARNLHFDCVELDSRGECLTFNPGTRLDRIHAILTQFDDLNR